MPVVRVWPSTNQGPRIYRKAHGPVSKQEAERLSKKYTPTYYTRVAKYKNGWAVWTTQGTGRLDVKFKDHKPVIGKGSRIPYEKR